MFGLWLACLLQMHVHAATVFVGSGSSGNANGIGTSASLNSAQGITVSSLGVLYYSDWTYNIIKEVSLATATVTFFAGGSSGAANGVGSNAQFRGPRGLGSHPSNGNFYVAEFANHMIRLCTPGGAVSTFAGGGSGGGTSGSNDGTGTAALFFHPFGVTVSSAGTVYVADADNNKIRTISPLGVVSTLAGGSTGGSTNGWVNGVGTAALFMTPFGVGISPLDGTIFVAENAGGIRLVTPSGVVSTLAGQATAGFANGVGTNAKFFWMFSVSVSTENIAYVVESGNSAIRTVDSAGNTATFAAQGGTSSCIYGNVLYVGGDTVIMTYPLPSVSTTPSSSPSPSKTKTRSPTSTGSPTPTRTSSVTPTQTRSASASPCNAPAGFFCAGSALTLCPAGTFTSTAGSTSCQQCPGGRYCPAGTSSWAHLKCGRGYYCPDGSIAPIPCPFQVPPSSGGWGDLQVQGPAFLVDTALCLNHCFWNFTSGDGLLSRC